MIEDTLAESAIYLDIEEPSSQTTDSIGDGAASDLTVLEQRQELVFIDTDVENYQELLNDILAQDSEGRNIEVIVLDNERDGIEQISEALANYQNLDAVHLISHGSDGNIDIGNTLLDANTLNQNLAEISAWGDAFTEEGDFLIYGCNLAATEDGQSLLQTLSSLTQTDVAASDDLTGQAELGGDWDLEYTQGAIETNIALSAEAQQQWSGILGTETVDDDFDDGVGGDTGFSGNDGSQNWIGNWQEFGGEEDGGSAGPSSGKVKVATDGANPAQENALRIGGNWINITGQGASREADLFSASTATLSFDYWISDFIELGQPGAGVLVEVSDDGGVSWTTLDTYVLNGSLTTTPTTASFDISAYTSANTQIRFIGSGEVAEIFNVDNVQIEYTTGNLAPVITSDGGGATASINIAENTTVVTTVTATDADLDTLTYSISGGADAAKFNINSTSGELTFTSTPDFENPTDFDTDNVYEVIVQANDGNGGIDTQSIEVTVTDVGQYLDQFNAVSYSGNVGTELWTNDWQELGAGETDGAGGGNVRVTTHIGLSGNALRIDSDVLGEGPVGQQILVALQRRP